MNFEQKVLMGKDKVKDWDDSYEKRLAHELEIISDKGFEDYFLILEDIIRWAIEDGIMVGPGRGCLKHDSPVLTNNGFKNISNIAIGEMVMAHDGCFYPVSNVFKYKNKDPMYKIRTYYDAQGVSVTPEHKMLVSKMNPQPNVGGRRFADKPSEVKWIRAKDVEEGDMLVIPRRNLGDKIRIDLAKYAPENAQVTDEWIIESFAGNQHRSSREEKIPRYLETNYDLGLFFGWWSADGWIVKSKNTSVGLCCNSDDDDGEVPKLVKRLFNVEASRYPSKKSKLVQYEFSSKTIVSFLKSLVPDYNFTSKTKSLCGFNLSWDEEYLKGLATGAWNGDGHHSNDWKSKHSYSSVSRVLVRDIRQVLWALGVPNSLRSQYRKETREGWGGDRIEYTLVSPSNFFSPPKNQMGYVDENFIYQRVFDVIVEDPEEYVYDIEVKDMHSFVTESYTVHNSSAGSLVAYLLGITKIDPLKYNLMFERFLNPARPDLPDVDLDFMSSRRSEVFNYIKNKYGEERTCLIATFSRFHVKQAIRDLCRIYEIPMETVNKLSKAIPTQVKTLDEAMKIPEVTKFMKKNKEIHELTEQLEGSIRQKSVHAAGIVITPDNLTNYISTEKVKGELCSCFDMQAIDFLGLLKIDILALKTLDVIARSLELAKITVEDLPEEFNDPEVYKVFQEGRTLGVFQFESPLLTGLSKKLAIDDFKTLYAATTIARPGPLHSGQADKYIKRRKGEEEPELLTPELEPITDETYGLMLFQEQSMQVAVQLANFTPVEAEFLRKVIGKSKGKEAIDEYADKFIEGCQENFIDKEIAEEIWNIIRESGAYQFNKSHAVSYSAISYWCAWLKAYYPKEFLVALMEFEEDDIQGNATRELREMGYKVHPPHINKSERNVHIASDGEIYMGISDVEGVGEKAVDEILENKPYETFDDFMGRVQKRRANSRVVRNLIQAGFFDVFGRRDSLFYTLDPDPYHEWDDEEMLRRQMMVLDIPSSTPLIEYYENPYEKYVEMINLKDIDFNEKVDEYWVKGIILDYSTRESSQNNLQEFFGEKQLMGFFDLDDGTKKVPCFIAPETLSLFSHRIKEGSPVLVKAHTYGKKEKLYVDGVIDLGNLDPDGTLEKYALDGRVKVLESFSSNKNVNVINYVTYHTSKNGKNYARITFENGEQGLCFNLDSNVFKSGEVIVWTSNKAPFINVQQRIS